MKWTLLALLAVAHGAIAQDRLRIEVVPVLIFPEGFPGGDYDIGKAPVFLESAPLVAVHEALDLLQWGGFRPSTVEVVHFGDIEILTCTYAQPNLSSTCTHYGRDQPLPFSLDQMDSLYTSLGHETPRDEPTPRDPGTVRILIILKSDHFPWNSGSTVLGKASVTSWNGWNPEDMHWSTMACTAWAYLDVPTIAVSGVATPRGLQLEAGVKAQGISASMSEAGWPLAMASSVALR